MKGDFVQTDEASQPQHSITAPDQVWWRNRRLQRDFLRHLWQQMLEHDTFLTAAALCYTTILALVPLLAVILGVVGAFPLADDLTAKLQDFVFSNFVPAAGATVQQYIEQFVGNTSTLTGAGSLFLVVTSLLLMQSIESNLNRIWQVRNKRSISSRLVMYWSVLTLGPIMMGGSIVLSSYLSFLPFGSRAGGLLLKLTPFLVAVFAFSLLYLVVPNRRVKPRYALIGALLAALLFELAKNTFVWYVTTFPTYTKLYGALATIPIFLVWVYVAWLITLLGAVVAAALTTFHFRQSEWHWPQRLEFVLVLHLFSHLWQAQQRGHGLGSDDLLQLEPAMSDDQLQQLMSELAASALVTREDSGDWLLNVDLAELSIADLYARGSWVLPVTDQADMPAALQCDRSLAALLAAIRQRSDAYWQTSVKHYLQGEPGHADHNQDPV
ncbi:MAG: YihY family inner membrane protein [Wenzhouxiangellaceae bacterium]